MSSTEVRKWRDSWRILESVFASRLAVGVKEREESKMSLEWGFVAIGRQNSFGP